MRTLGDLLAAVGGRMLARADGAPTGVSIDTRTLSRGDLFFALRGPSFDGHDFVAAAFERGAWGAVVAEGFAPSSAVSGALIAVPDTVRALQEMSRARRADLEVPFVGVTGSVGKTTTKEAVARALSARFRVTKTEGNLNNHLGVPLSILRIPPDATAAVYELAMTAPGEIRFLAELTRPVVGVVTNVAEVHLESMGDLDAVASAKQELVEALPREGAAIASAELLGVPATEARDALRGFQPASGRSAFRPLGRARLLDDAYNASPASMRAAVAALCERPGGAARIVVLGDMLELGERAEALHEELGAHLARQPIDLLFLHGPLCDAVERGARRGGMSASAVRRFASHAEIAAALRERLRPGDHLLVKGSRGMRMEEVILLLEADLPEAIRPAKGEA